jgi:hypothetical protein
MTSVEKFVVRLREYGYPIPKKYSFQRCRPGHWQRAAGAWSWSIHWKNGHCGSSDSVKRCLKSKTWHDGPWNEIYPVY